MHTAARRFGCGQNLFPQSGIAPRLPDSHWTIVELGDANAGFAALAAGNSSLLVLDQFEQSLIRFASDEEERRAFEDAVAAWPQAAVRRKLIFGVTNTARPSTPCCPSLAQHKLCPSPLRPEKAAHVLSLLLDNVSVKYDKSFLPQLCAEYLAESVPKTVLPALLQLVAQYCRNRGLKLDKAAWDRLLSSESSLFEDHIRESVLGCLPGKLSRWKSLKVLPRWSRAMSKSRRKSVAEIAEDYQLNPNTVSRTLEFASLPHARDCG